MKNQQTQALISELKKTAIEQQVPLWKRIAEELEAPSKARRVVNTFKIDANAADGEIIIVPGKAVGKISKHGKTMTIQELMKSNPKASKVKILG